MTTPTLQGIKKTVTLVDYNDVNDFVTEAFPELSHCDEYNCACVEEYSNDTRYEKSVFPMPGFDNYTTKYRIQAGQWPFLGDLLNVACGRGLIEAGDYLIRVSW